MAPKAKPAPGRADPDPLEPGRAAVPPAPRPADIESKGTVEPLDDEEPNLNVEMLPAPESDDGNKLELPVAEPKLNVAVGAAAGSTPKVKAPFDELPLALTGADRPAPSLDV